MQKYSLPLLIVLLTAFSGFKSWQISSLKTQIEQAQTQLDGCSNDQQLLRSQINTIKDNDTQKIVLSDGSAKVNTCVYYNPTRQEIALDLGGIPAPPAGKTHWIWGEQAGKYVLLGKVALSAVGSWQSIPYQAHLTRFFIAVGGETNQLDFPEIVILQSQPI